VKDAIITEREESGRPVTDIEGDFEHFVLEDMDMWGGHFKFEIKNNRIDGSDDRESRAIISEGMPGFGHKPLDKSQGLVPAFTRFSGSIQRNYRTRQ
jgi:hypothetical protein